MCKPTGQMISVGKLYAVADRVVMVVPTVTVGDILQRVDSFVIMEDVEATAMTSHLLFSIQGPGSSEFLTEQVRQTNDLYGLIDEGLWIYPNDRSGLGGYDILVPTESMPNWLKELPCCSEAKQNELEILHGFARWGVEIQAKTLPAELGEKFLSEHVSYNKGCYTGQEVIMRMHSRGHANWKWMRADIDGIPTENAALSHPERDEAGQILRFASLESGRAVASVRVRAEVANEGEELWVNGPEPKLKAALHEYR